jgi:hypothetical protein
MAALENNGAVSCTLMEEGKMNECVLDEPIELTDAELELVSGGDQSQNGFVHEDANENFHAQNNENVLNNGGHPREVGTFTS